MTQALHSQARTTHLIREEIKNSTLPQAELARLYNVTRQTIRKWQDRESPVDGRVAEPVPQPTRTLLELLEARQRDPSHGTSILSDHFGDKQVLGN
jgi:DNA-binding transcriptional regulator YiaG